MTDSTSPFTSRWRLGLILLAGSALTLAGFVVLALRWRSPSVEKQADPFRIVWTFEPPQRGAIAAGTCITERWIHVACIRYYLAELCAK